MTYENPIQNNAGKPKGKLPRAAILAIILVPVLLIVSFSSFTTVNEGYIGVKSRFGKIVGENLQPGLNFKLPFVDEIVKIDVREQVYQANTTAYTRDTQTVESLQIKLNYYYDPAALSEIIRNVGIANVESKLIVPQVMSILKNEFGQFRAEELIQNRSSIQVNIQDKLSDSLAKSGIIVVSFALENIDFESGFEEAVRAKVVAEQDALKMQNKTLEKEELAKQTVIEAEAAAAAAKLRAEAEAYSIQVVQEELASSPEYLDFQKIQKWDGAFPQAMGETINPFLVFGESGGSSTYVPPTETE